MVHTSPSQWICVQSRIVHSSSASGLPNAYGTLPMTAARQGRTESWTGGQSLQAVLYLKAPPAQSRTCSVDAAGPGALLLA